MLHSIIQYGAHATKQTGYGLESQIDAIIYICLSFLTIPSTPPLVDFINSPIPFYYLLHFPSLLGLLNMKWKHKRIIAFTQQAWEDGCVS